MKHKLSITEILMNVKGNLTKRKPAEAGYVIYIWLNYLGSCKLF